MFTEFDKKLLNRIQNHFPICSEPFQQLAIELESDEETVLARVKALKNQGFIRRIGSFFNSYALGFESTLVAVIVKPEFIESVASAVNQYDWVTHNYAREGTFNLWFTLITPDKEQQITILQDIEKLEGVETLLSLPAEEKFKVNVMFDLG